MNSLDHRYDNIINKFRSYPQLGLLRMFPKLIFIHLLQLQAKIDAFENKFESPATGASDDATITENHSAEQQLQVDSTQDIGPTLKEYLEFLWLVIRIINLQPPHPRDVKYLRDNIQELMSGIKQEGEELDRGQQDTAPWHADDDFVALYTNSHERFDRFTNWVWEKLEFFHNYIFPFRTLDPTLPGGGAYAYNRRALASIVTLISVIVAVSMNLSSIYALYFIENMQMRLGVIMIYTPIFALMMLLLTNSGTASIFPATASYVAVLVVFIGNNNNNSN